MSLVRNALLLGIFVMLLPAEEKSQRAEIQTAAARSFEHTATYCDRNPSTCSAAREMWAELRLKAAQGLALGAQALQAQLDQANKPASRPPARTAAFGEAAIQQPEPLRLDPPRRRPAPAEETQRWR